GARLLPGRLPAPADPPRSSDRALVPLQHHALCERGRDRLTRRAGAVAPRARCRAARGLLAAFVSAASCARQTAAEHRHRPHLTRQGSLGGAAGRAISLAFSGLPREVNRQLNLAGNAADLHSWNTGPSARVESSSVLLLVSLYFVTVLVPRLLVFPASN